MAAHLRSGRHAVRQLLMKAAQELQLVKRNESLTAHHQRISGLWTFGVVSTISCDVGIDMSRRTFRKMLNSRLRTNVVEKRGSDIRQPLDVSQL